MVTPRMLSTTCLGLVEQELLPRSFDKVLKVLSVGSQILHCPGSCLGVGHGEVSGLDECMELAVAIAWSPGSLVNSRPHRGALDEVKRHLKRKGGECEPFCPRDSRVDMASHRRSLHWSTNGSLAVRDLWTLPVGDKDSGGIDRPGGGWRNEADQIQWDMAVINKLGKPLKGLLVSELVPTGLDWAPESRRKPAVEVVLVLLVTGSFLAGNSTSGTSKDSHQVHDLVFGREIGHEMTQDLAQPVVGRWGLVSLGLEGRHVRR